MMHVHVNKVLKNKMNVCLNDSFFRFCCQFHNKHTSTLILVANLTHCSHYCQQIVASHYSRSETTE